MERELELIAALTAEFGEPKVYMHTLDSGRKFETHCWTVTAVQAAAVALFVIASPVHSQISRSEANDEVEFTVYLHREEVQP